jgi:hypothetical protein
MLTQAPYVEGYVDSLTTWSAAGMGVDACSVRLMRVKGLVGMVSRCASTSRWRVIKHRYSRCEARRGNNIAKS